MAFDRSKWTCVLMADRERDGETYLNGYLFVGTQAGCARAAKDCKLPQGRYWMTGLKKFEYELVKTGKVRVGKMLDWFKTNSSVFRPASVYRKWY